MDAVKVLEKHDRTVTLRVEMFYHDMDERSENLGFALMVLREGANGHPGAPLATEISVENTLDCDWLELYTRGFIESLRSSIESRTVWSDLGQDAIMGSLTLTVTVTDPAWIAHLRPGAEFASRAVSVASRFEDCEPIHPGQIDPDAPAPEAFISVPGALWNNTFLAALWNGSGLPAAVRAPAYSVSAYHTPNLRTGTFNAADLTDLDGEVVVYQEGHYPPSVGFLSRAGESIICCYLAGAGGYGSLVITPFTGSIGKAALIPGQRLSSRLRLSHLLHGLEPVLLGAAVDGGVATFRIAMPPGDTSLRSLSEELLVGLALRVLLAPLLACDESYLDPSPLSWTVEREVRRVFPAEESQFSHYVDGQSISAVHRFPYDPAVDRFPYDRVQRLARGFIAAAEVVSEDPDRIGDVDALDVLSEAQQRELLERPWPELVLKVTPHHVVYLQHLEKPFNPLPTGFANSAEPWEGPPATPATGPTGFGRSGQPAPGRGDESGPDRGR